VQAEGSGVRVSAGVKRGGNPDSGNERHAKRGFLSAIINDITTNFLKLNSCDLNRWINDTKEKFRGSKIQS